MDYVTAAMHMARKNQMHAVSLEALNHTCFIFKPCLPGLISLRERVVMHQNDLDAFLPRIQMPASGIKLLLFHESSIGNPLDVVRVTFCRVQPNNP